MSLQVGRSPVRALVFPADDYVFAERVREILDEDANIDAALTALNRQLAVVHPRIAVSVRSPLAGFGGGPVVYVYRDGSALSRLGRDDWARDPSTARLVTDTTGSYIEVNEEAAVLFGVGRHEIIGRRAGSFTRPDARIQDADALWKALETTGRLHSLAVVRRADGEEIPVEFVTVRDGDGEGRNLTVMRPVG